MKVSTTTRCSALIPLSHLSAVHRKPILQPYGTQLGRHNTEDRTEFLLFQSSLLLYGNNHHKLPCPRGAVSSVTFSSVEPFYFINCSLWKLDIIGPSPQGYQDCSAHIRPLYIRSRFRIENPMICNEAGQLSSTLAVSRRRSEILSKHLIHLLLPPSAGGNTE